MYYAADIISKTFLQLNLLAGMCYNEACYMYKGTALYIPWIHLDKSLRLKT